MRLKFWNKYLFILVLLILLTACSEEKSVMPPNCTEGEENSILQECTELNKTCIVKSQVASCDACFTGYKLDGDTCVKLQSCSDLKCEDQNKYCEHFDLEEDAECVDCLPKFKLVEDNCQAVIECDILNCSSQNKECIESGIHSNAECGKCVDFFKKEGELCSPVTKCEELNCEQENKPCTQNNVNADAVCSKDCLNGFHKDENDVCVETIDCEVLNCFDNNRVCIAASPIENASCGRCLGGFAENESNTCVAMGYTTCDPKPAQGSILLECTQEHKNCIPRTNDTNASCGDCVAGYELVNNRCIIPTKCTMLNCEKAHKDCNQIPNSENWECGNCKEGFTFNSEDNICECNSGTILNEETNLCETLKTCNDITCSNDESCIEGNNNYHAYCSKCEEGEAWDGISCKSCFECNAKGETGKVYPITSIQKHCVCETKENYFYSRSSLSTKSCDEDKDGWITEEARVVINAPENSTDKINARCDIRYINKFILKNENEQTRIITISELTKNQYTKVPLYEVESRDSQEKLEIDYNFGTSTFFAPAYGLGTADVDTFYFNASQLNMLTKAIPAGSKVNKADQADYNANGTPDLDEKPWDITIPSSVDDIFMKFSYFIELNSAWYQKESDEKYGSYVISEKKRDSNAPLNMHVELNDPSNKAYWRECFRKRDSKFNSPKGTGLDFAEFHYASCTLGDLESWCGMNHHSQFKPFKIVAANDLDPLNPQYITVADLENNYIVNKCFSHDGQYDIMGNGEYNPRTPILECLDMDNLQAQLSIGDLVWAISKYKEYNNIEKYYTRGCIDECTDMGSLPEDERCVGGVKCSTAPGDFGKLICSEGIIMSKIIPGGLTFMIGSEVDPEDTDRNDDEIPTYMKLSQSYEISTKEIDQTIFEIVMEYNPSFYSCGRSSCPVESLTWYDAVAFANRYTELRYATSDYNCYTLTDVICDDGSELTESQANNDEKKYCQDKNGIKSATVVSENYLTCAGYRLPTETEWEFAAKGRDYNQKYYTPFGYNSWTTTTTCEANEICSTTSGVSTCNEISDTCMDGQKRCHENNIEVCDDENNWTISVTCSGDKVCQNLDSNYECIFNEPQNCVVGEQHCDNNEIKECIPNELSTLSEIAWFNETEAIRTQATGLKLPNKYFLFDMLGNVKEWVHDYYTQYPATTLDTALVDHTNTTPDLSSLINSARVIRGGGFDSNAAECRNMARDFLVPEEKSNSIGFRIARSYAVLTCRVYLKYAKTAIERSSVKGIGEYTSEYDETENKYHEKFYDNLNVLIMERIITYSSKEDFITESKSSKDNFLTKEINIYNQNVLETSYIFTKTDDNIIVNIESNDNFEMSFPRTCSSVNECAGTLETDECTGISLKVKYTQLEREITLDYANSTEREAGGLEICKDKGSETLISRVDSLGNIINFDWINTSIKVNSSVYDQFINICK